MSQRKKYWDAIIEQYKASGLSRPAFCKQNDLSCNQFQYRWCVYNRAEKANTKLAVRENSSPLNNFESVILSTPACTPQEKTYATELMIHLPNQISCAVKMDFRTNEFTTLLKQLVTLC